MIDYGFGYTGGFNAAIHSGFEIMSHSELLEQLQQLPRAEKFQMMQFLIAELAKEEAIVSFDPGTIHRVWSPYDYGDAVQKLMSLLEQENNTEDRNERHNEIYNNFMLAQEEEKNGELKFSSNINELRQPQNLEENEKLSLKNAAEMMRSYYAEGSNFTEFVDDCPEDFYEYQDYA